MEIIVSAFIGAFSAIIVAFINKKKEQKTRDMAVETLVNELNINTKNIYVVDTKKRKDEITFESHGSEKTNLIIIK